MLDVLLAQALAAPNGPSDSGWHVGQIVSWDESSGTNVVMVNNVALTNLKSIATGIGVQFQAGDNVLILRKQTQYIIMGEMQVPGGNQSNQIKSATVNTGESTASTTFTDLATLGPQVTVNIGSNRRALVFVGARILCSGSPANQYIGGQAGFQVTGASAMGPGFSAWCLQYSVSGVGIGFTQDVLHSVVLTAADGLNAGSNTFTMKYLSTLASPTCGFQGRILTVIPF